VSTTRVGGGGGLLKPQKFVSGRRSSSIRVRRGRLWRPEQQQRRSSILSPDPVARCVACIRWKRTIITGYLLCISRIRRPPNSRRCHSVAAYVCTCACVANTNRGGKILMKIRSRRRRVHPPVHPSRRYSPERSLV